MRRPRAVFLPIRPRFIIALLAGTFAVSVSAQAEDVRITFLPPPLEGTLSVGIYSVEGRLARILATDVLADAFTIGLNGLITSWNGRNDSGMELPAGKYFVRGFAVGDVQVEGSAFHGNDWYESETSPQVRDLKSITVQGRELLLNAVGADEHAGCLVMDLDTGTQSYRTIETIPEPVREVPGAGGTIWRIEEDGVVQRRGDEVLRRLGFNENEPRPFALGAASDRDELYLLERDARGVRLRAMRLKESKAEADGKVVSEWEVFLQKQIAAQETFAQAIPALGREQPPTVEEKLRIALIPNELQQVAPAALLIAVGVDEQGSLLKTADGLPLRRLTDTKHLRWAALSLERDGTVTLFQSNGAVIEEYQLRKLTQMMAFDAGEYEWTPAK